MAGRVEFDILAKDHASATLARIGQAFRKILRSHSARPSGAPQSGCPLRQVLLVAPPGGGGGADEAPITAVCRPD
jgi:hypothetical protein